MSVKTYDNVAYNSADYPSLKHFWRCTERTGATVMADDAGAANIPNAVTSNGAYALDPASGLNTATAALPAYTGEDWLFIISCKIGIGTGLALVGAAHYLRLDDGTAAGTGFQIVGAGGTATTLGAASDNALHSFALAFDASANITPYEDGTAGTTQAASAAGNADLSAGKIALSGCTEMYGMALFTFTAGNLPPTGVISAGVQWMHTKWQEGNKGIYPGFAGMLIRNFSNNPALFAKWITF